MRLACCHEPYPDWNEPDGRPHEDELGTSPGGIHDRQGTAYSEAFETRVKLHPA